MILLSSIAYEEFLLSFLCFWQVMMWFGVINRPSAHFWWILLSLLDEYVFNQICKVFDHCMFGLFFLSLCSTRARVHTHTHTHTHTQNSHFSYVPGLSLIPQGKVSTPAPPCRTIRCDRESSQSKNSVYCCEHQRYKWYCVMWGCGGYLQPMRDSQALHLARGAPA